MADVEKGVEQASGLYYQYAPGGGSAPGSAPPVIAMHGLFGESDNLGALAQALQPHFDVYRLDLRNHGQSSRSERMDFDAMADDISCFMRGKGIDRAYLFGHSLGGKVAMQLALNRPGAVARLVVADIAPVAYPPHHNRILEGLQHSDPGAAGTRAAVDKQLQPYVETAQVRQFLLKNLARDERGQMYWRFNVPVIAERYDQLRESVDGGAFDGPVLFIKGERSDYITPGHREAIETRFPQARLKVVNGAGHWLHAEKPAAFNRLVLNFLLHG